MHKGALFTLAFVVIFICGYTQNNSAGSPPIKLKEQPVYTSLAKALRNAEKAYKLNLSNTQLQKFPEDIFKLTELRVLILDSNQLDSIPARIKELKKLKVLSLSDNKITSLPAEIGSFSDLEKLFLDNNRLTQLPAELFYLNTLEVLLIDNNKLEVFPGNFKQLKELTTLNASHNEFSTLPLEIGLLYNLEWLSLSNNHLSKLPETFYELSLLSTLVLDNNSLTSLSPEIIRLKNLEILTLDSNKLTSLPPEVDRLYNLKELYLGNNNITQLPDKLDDLVNLTKLDLSNNPVRFDNDINQLQKLEFLYIKNVPIEKFPQDLYDVQNNGVKVIGLKSKELYNVKLLLSQGKNMQLVKNHAGAIKKYQQALESDTNNAQALSGMATAYLDLGNYDSSEVVCKKALTKNPNSELLKEIKATYSGALKRTNKYDAIIQGYELRIKEATNNAQPCFELGKYYYDNEKYADAEKTFQRALDIDPLFSNAHFYLAVTALSQEREASFILSTVRFLTVERSDRRAKTILPFLFSRMNLHTGVKSKGGTTHYYDSYIIRNEANEIIFKNDNPLGELIIAMTADLLRGDVKKDKNDTLTEVVLEQLFHANKNNVEIFKIELEKLCNTKPEERKKEDDFFWNYYQPYFSSLIQSGHLETLSYMINNIRREESYITDWLKNNSDKVEKFTSWNKSYSWGK